MSGGSVGQQDHGRVGDRTSYPHGQTRSALRRLARARQRRRWLLEALAAFACLAALVAYLGTERHDTPREESAVLPVAPTGRPVLPPPGGTQPGAVTPGLRPRQRPPSPSPSSSTPAVPPTLTVSQSDVPARVDLSAVGAVDWVQWGHLGARTPVRKRHGSGDIRDEGGRGRRQSYSNNPEAYAWRDGAPVGSVDGTMSGVYTCDRGSGFTLAVAADGQPRTVHLYAGLWMARARLDLRISGGGPASTVRLEDPHTVRTADFTIRFRAPAGAKLLMSWTVEESLGDCGNVSLQAVALR
ncbi:hypothetical protein RMN56_05650 [Micromonospora halotolerans]|uniref:Glycosyl hydrolase family 98 putative carbohydrate-binding module domain-containing protein n=1 Tax=Micromonospora halotolerans TaxID=709879 RepID=A0ABY9ZZT6_9ACTN|nr:hypothetical protein [Micromonospora halotolerans]WNM40831.1 hypothetical protein RMN56_05650 [Micromonospora halotolerans]